MISKFNTFNDFKNGNLHFGDNLISFQGSISGGAVDNDLVMEWTTTSDGDSIELSSPVNTIIYNYDVDWGDGSSESNVTTNDKTHTYTTAGTYEVRIKSSSSSFCLDMSLSTSANRVQLKKFKNWGNVALQSVRNMFMNATSMVYEATDYPNLTALSSSATYKSARQMFRNCTSMTDLDISNWQNTELLTTSNAWQYFLFDCHNLATFNGSNLTCASSCTTFIYFAHDVGKNVGCNFTMDDCSFTGATDLSNFFQSLKLNTTFSVQNWTLNPTPNTCNMTNLFYNVDSNAGTGNINLDLSGWTNTACSKSFSNMYRGCNALGEINMTNWNTENVTNFSFMFYTNYQVTKLEGLSGWSSASATTCVSMFYFAYKMSFPTGTSNFGTAWATNLGAVNFTNFMTRCGFGQAGGYGNAPDVTNWDMSSVTSITSMFSEARFTNALEPQSWDVSSVTGSVANFMLGNDGTTGTLDLSAWNFTNAVTNMTNFIRGTEISELIFSNNADFSGVTTMAYFGYVAPNLTTLTFGASISFASCTSWVNAFTSVTLDTASYDAILIRNDATNTNTPVTLTAGGSKYTKAPSSSATARANLVTLGWTITDGGATP